jgi:hypothetical protein
MIIYGSFNHEPAVALFSAFSLADAVAAAANKGPAELELRRWLAEVQQGVHGGAQRLDERGPPRTQRCFLPH